MRIPAPAFLLATTTLLAVPACNCGSKDSSETSESASPSVDNGPRVRGDADVLEVVERLGDRGAAVVVAHPERWSELHAALGPVLDALPPGATPLVESARTLPQLGSLALGLPSELPGLDLTKPVVASFGEVPYDGPPGSATPSLPVREHWMPPVRHQIWVPATDAAALVSSLATALEGRGTTWPDLVEGREGARGIELGERDAIALLPEDGAVRVVVLQSSGGLIDQARLDHLRGRLDAEPAKPASTPAISRLADSDAVVSGLVRPWRVRPMAAWHGASQVLEALVFASNDQRGVMFARGMQIVLDTELLMTDAGAEFDDMAASLVVDEGVLRLRSTMTLTPEGETILSEGLDEAGGPFMPKTEDAWIDLALRWDARAALDASEAPPVFDGIRDVRPREVSEMIQEGGYFTTLYMGARHPLGMMKLLETLAGTSAPVPMTTLPTVAHVVWTGMESDMPRGTLALQWPKGASTSAFDGFMGSVGDAVSLRTHSAEREGAPVTMMGLGIDPPKVLDPTASGDSDALLQAKISLDRIASLVGDEPVPKALLRGEMLMTWRHEKQALQGELAWSPAGKDVSAAKVPGSTRQREDSPMGPEVDAEAATCLRQAGWHLARGLRALPTIAPDQVSTIIASAMAEAEAGLTCAAKNDDTAEAAVGLRRMAVELTVDVMDRGHDYQAAQTLLQAQCKVSEDEQLCAQLEQRAALPHPKRPEIDWSMECDPAYGLPAGDFVVRMDAKGVAIDGTLVSDESSLASQIASTASKLKESAVLERPPMDDEPSAPSVKAELIVDEGLAMTRVRPLLRALLDAGVTQVVVPVRGTRRDTGALVAGLVLTPSLTAPPAAPAAPSPGGMLGMVDPSRGLFDEWAYFEVGRDTVTTSSSLRPEPQPHASPSTSLLRDSKDDAAVVYVYPADDATWADVAATLGGACPSSTLALEPRTP